MKNNRRTSMNKFLEEELREFLIGDGMNPVYVGCKNGGSTEASRLFQIIKFADLETRP
jgi:hypothetical protein